MKINKNRTSILFIQIFLIVYFVGITFSSTAQEVVSYDSKEWNRKQNRDEFARIFSGEVDKAIDRMDKFLLENKNDTEVLYGLSVAYYSKKDNEKGLDYFNKAIEAGIAIERFMTGPKNILSFLFNEQEFKNLIQKKQLIHGPMTGTVTSNSAKVWIRTFSETSFKIIVASDSLMSKPVGTFSGSTQKSDDFTGIAKIDNLRPDSKYFYTLEVSGNKIPGISTFKTFPKEGDAGLQRIAFGGGAAFNPDFEHIWTVIANQKPNLFLGMGDNIYIDHPELPEVQRHCYYQRESVPQFRKMQTSVPYYSIWDDHDFGVNDSYGTPDKFIPAWKTDVLKVYKDNTLNPYYAGGEAQPGTWYNFSMGQVDFFMLDTRYYRTPSTDANPNMLGTAQMSWLKDKLKNSKGAFKVIVSSVPWADGAKDAMEGRFDTWKGYSREREEIFTFLTQNSIEGVVLLSADRHRHDAWKHERPDDYSLYEFTSSRLTNLHYHELRTDALFGYNQKNGFGLLEFNTKAEQPYMVFKTINIDNELINQVRIYLHQLNSDK